MKNTSYSITASVDIPAGGANGVIITQGGYFAGTALMLLQGKPTFEYAFSHYPDHKWKVQAPQRLTLGKHTIVMDFVYAGDGEGKSAKVTLLVDGKQVAQGDIPRTVPTRFSPDETLDIGSRHRNPFRTITMCHLPSRRPSTKLSSILKAAAVHRRLPKPN
jgi:arylsulfatase